MDRTNPATGEDLEPISDDSEEEVAAALDRATETFTSVSARRSGPRISTGASDSPTASKPG
ncbi:hypothetical protein [Halorussus litoreus]|uniref:hypothetical protein n=1 Tax=Halorussus litoreus TaxID=1710536 RepID=UPI000E223E41|nr:hypothetical protein [Halorussus litoreus]